MTQTASKRFPTAAALEYRLPVCPVSKGVEAPFCSNHGDVKWVRVERGRPTARHRDVLDAIMVSATTMAIDAVGRVHVIFDVADVRDTLGGKSIDWTKIRDYLLDLQATTISIRRPGDDWPESWPMLAIVGDAKAEALRRAHLYSGKMKRIAFSEGVAALLESETRLYVNKNVVRQVLRLQNQVSRSVARWLISHSGDQHQRVDTVLSLVGAGGGERQQRKFHKQLRDDAEGLKRLGISFEGGILHYQRNVGVFIEHPETLVAQGEEQKRAVSEQKRAVEEPKRAVP